jgi:uncharacterized membrane protein YkoI
MMRLAHWIIAPRGLAIFGVLVLCGAILSGATQPRAQSAATALEDCLAPRAMREAVAGKGVVAPASAVMTARQQVPDAEVVRANLCRHDDVLVYIIMALQKDGRLVQVTIDGSSGRVKSVH